MSIITCSYQDCMSRRMPCSSIAFFGFPNDSRRPIWIRNSGNKKLTQLTAKQKRFLCEQHFRASDMRCQFNRKTLRYAAVPKPHPSVRVEDAQTSASVEEVEQDFVEQVEEEEIEVPMLQADVSQTAETEHVQEYADTEPTEPTVGYVDYEEGCYLNSSADISDARDANGTPVCLDFVEEDTENLAQDAEESFNSAYDSDLESSDFKCKVEIEKNAVAEDPANQVSPTIVSVDVREDYASDRHFALSLINYFQRLGAEKKAIAKVKILMYLTALEFGQGGDL